MPTKREIFETIQTRLTNGIQEANERTCWIDDAPLPLSKDAVPDRFGFSISPADGRFPTELQTGGSLCGMIEQSAVVITYMERIQQDQAKKLTIATKRMMEWQRKILAAVLIDFDGSVAKRWNPLGLDGLPLFASQIRPALIVDPKRHQDWPLLYQYIQFEFDFAWSLT